MLQTAKHGAHIALRHIGMEGAAMRARDRQLARRALRHNHTRLGPDRLPVPPGELIDQVAGTTDPDWYLNIGREGAQVITRTLARNGIDINHADAILDFGVGCGRIARWLTDTQGTVHGCDYNPVHVDWCQRNLPHLDARRNTLNPPLEYRAGLFDVIYALSVFTHLTGPQQVAWMTELRRVLKPGGVLLFTTHGPNMPHKNGTHRAPGITAKLAAGELVVLQADHAGRNACAALHPPEWVKTHMLTGFELLEYVENGATMNGGQDLWLARAA